MGLGIVHHLEPVFDFAMGAVECRQFRGGFGRNPFLFGQGSEARDRFASAQIGVTAPGDQLAGLGEEFNLADAADAQLHVVAFDLYRAMQPAMVADAQPHVMGVLDRREIQVLAPDKRRQRFLKPVTGGQITGAGPRLDPGGPLPCPADTFIVAFGGGHRDADRRDRRVRAQPQIGAKDIAIGGAVRDQRHHLAGDPQKRGPCLLRVAGIAGFVEQANQVDVGGIVQLARAHLAHRKDHHATGGRGIVGAGTGQSAAADFSGNEVLQAEVHRTVRKVSQRTGHLLQRPDATQIAQRRQQRQPSFGKPQRRAELFGGRAVQ